MEFNNQVYRAPSLPKMNRRNISSSVMSGAQTGAAAPKLRRSSFSFVGAGRAKIASGLKIEKADVGVQLEDTNRILIEIQKQLALDFGNRIVEKRQLIAASKAQVSRQRASDKESAIESMRKSGAGIIKVFEKVAAPAKGIFQRILDFFSIILTGLLVNNAFKWLENPANRAKVEKFFNFVVKHWKELLALYGTYKLIKIVGALKRIADLFKKPPRWPGGGGRGGGTDPKKPQPGGCGAVVGCAGAIVTAVVASGALLLELAKGIVPALVPLLLGEPAFAAANPDAIVTDYVDDATLPSKSDSSLFPPQFRPFIEWATGWRKTELGQKIEEIEATLGLLTAVFGGVRGLRGVRGAKSLPTEGPLANLGQGAKNTKPKFAKSTRVDFSRERKIIDQAGQPGGVEITGGGLSGGGTVGGTGSGFVDSVNAMLAPGEEVIRASAAMLFRPLLKDINNNAGRLWNTLSTAVISLIKSNETLESGMRRLKTELDNFKIQLDSFISQEKLRKENKGGGIGQMPAPPRTGMVAPEVVLHSDIKQPPRRRAKSSVVPIQLPPQTLPPTNMPKFSSEGATATEEPEIGSTNPINPYMVLTPQILGIFV